MLIAVHVHHPAQLAHINTVTIVWYTAPMIISWMPSHRAVLLLQTARLANTQIIRPDHV